MKMRLVLGKREWVLWESNLLSAKWSVLLQPLQCSTCSCTDVPMVQKEFNLQKYRLQPCSFHPLASNSSSYLLLKIWQVTSKIVLLGSQTLLNARHETQILDCSINQLHFLWLWNSCQAWKMYKDLFQGWWRWALFLIVPLEAGSLSNDIWEKSHLQTLTMWVQTHLGKQTQMSTAISATSPLEGGSETEPLRSDRDN